MFRIYSLAATAALAALTSAGHTLRYDRPARFFEEALVIGNGTLGATVYGGTECDRLSLNDITFWSGEPDTTVFSPDAFKAVPEVRALLERGDYAAAEREARRIEGRFSQSYQPLGNLIVDFPGHEQVDGYERTLDLDNARAVTSYSHAGRSYRREYFASAPDSLIVMSLETDNPSGLDFTLRFESPHPHTVSASDGSLAADGYAPCFAYPVYYNGSQQKNFYDPERGTRFSSRIHVELPQGGSVSATPDGRLAVSKARRALVYVTNVTSFNGFDRNPATDGRPQDKLADRRIVSAVESGFDSISARQLADHRNLFGRVSLWLGDTDDALKALPTDRQLLDYSLSGHANPELEALYFQYGRYLLISCSRTDGVPANLQGLWNEHITPPWSCNYTTNINLEENYWGAETTNLPELHRPLLGFIRNLSVSGRATARHYFGVDSAWCMGHNSDIWALTNPVGMRESCPSWAMWSMGGAWLSTHIWEHYLFGRDRDFLARYYPVLRDAARFCLQWLVERDGELITSPGTSPENFFVTPDGVAASVSYGNTSDLAIARECMSAASAAAARLGTDEQLRHQLDSAMSRLRPYHVKADGSLSEWYHDDFSDQDPKHRHQSHLVGLYPGHHINPVLTPDIARACGRTLEIKGKQTTGWSAGWRVNLLARLADGEGAYEMLRALLNYVSPDGYTGPDRRGGGGTYPNMLDAHAPFQIDGNFGGSAGIAEMLVQSTADGVITLLPALPSAWPCGRVSGLRTRCAVTVDNLSWSDGRIESLTLTSTASEPVTVTLHHGDSTDTVRLLPGATVTVLNFV